MSDDNRNYVWGSTATITMGTDATTAATYTTTDTDTASLATTGTPWLFGDSDSSGNVNWQVVSPSTYHRMRNPVTFERTPPSLFNKTKRVTYKDGILKIKVASATLRIRVAGALSSNYELYEFTDDRKHNPVAKTRRYMDGCEVCPSCKLVKQLVTEDMEVKYIPPCFDREVNMKKIRKFLKQFEEKGI